MDLPASAFNETWIRVAAAIGPRTLVDASWALEHNATLALGSIAVRGGAVVVNAVLPPTTTLEDLKLALETVPHEAARRREGGAKDTPAPAMFYEYAA